MKFPHYLAISLSGLALLVFSWASWSSISSAQQEFIYDAQGKRNPFIPLVSSDGRYLQLDQEQTAQKKEELVLEGIIYDKYGISYAVVGGEVVRIGDNIRDYQVLKIEKSKVVFIKDGQLKTVEIIKEEK